MTRNEFIANCENLYCTLRKSGTRINYNQCWYYDTDKYILLKSYNTIVACYRKSTESVYIFDYYSAATSQHIGKFMRIVNPVHVFYLYKRNDRIDEIHHYGKNTVYWKLNAKERKLVESHDYSSKLAFTF